MDRIIDAVSDGQNLRDFCRNTPGAPNWNTFYKWTVEFPDFYSRYARARDIGTDAMAHDLMSMITQEPERVITGYQTDTDPETGEETSTPIYGRIDHGYVAWQKAQADIGLRLLSKWNPKRYGDRNQIETPEDERDNVIEAVEMTYTVKEIGKE